MSIGLLGALLGNAKPLSAAEQDPVTAIDILLEPDQTMVERATAANQRLLKVLPEGFALDKTHTPHISILQRYVRTADLDKVYEAVGKVLAEEKPAGWELKAYKYYYIPWKDLGLAGIVIESTADLIRYQQKLIDAVTPFTVKTGTAAAFITTQNDPDINQPTWRTLCRTQAARSSIHTSRSASLPSDYLNRMLDEKFEAFTFSPVGASVYHLGNFGTAQKKLKGWNLQP